DAFIALHFRGVKALHLITQPAEALFLWFINGTLWGGTEIALTKGNRGFWNFSPRHHLFIQNNRVWPFIQFAEGSSPGGSDTRQNIFIQNHAIFLNSNGVGWRIPA